MLRPSAAVRIAELMPYVLWLDYAASLADRCADEKKQSYD
jgi:hypothetical protein